MVGEAVWSGGATTAPTPVTVAQAAAAFGTIADSYPFPIEICPLSNLPGIPLLPFSPRGSSIGADGYPVVIIAVFPTAQLLAAAAPEAAARGESNTDPGGTGSCMQMSSRTVHWLARANILVGVQYDSTKDPDADLAVLEARADIAKLANQ